jgi:hypothetical protein
MEQMKKIFKDPWTIATYTILGTYLLSLTNITFFVTIWKWFNYRVPMPIWLIIAILLIVLITSKYLKKPTAIKKDIKVPPLPPELAEYTEDTFDKIKFNWRWKFDQDVLKWEVDGLIGFHPEDNGEIIIERGFHICSKCRYKYYDFPSSGRLNALIRNKLREHEKM